MDSSHAGWVVAAVLAVVWLWALLRRALDRRRRRRRLHRALRAESDAEKLLARAGFVIEGRQVSLQWPIRCDGVEHPVSLRADLLVRRGGLRYVADVKTGALAPRLGHAPTRRQLLEYVVAYDVDGVLLIDMQAREIRDVRFPVIAGWAEEA